MAAPTVPADLSRGDRRTDSPRRGRSRNTHRDGVRRGRRRRDSCPTGGRGKALDGAGPAAYLDAEAVLAAATGAGCELLHPGYGFLSENAGFAARCAEAGIGFVGPAPAVLELFGDKARARGLAERLGVPVLAGTRGPTTLTEAHDFLAGLGAGGALMVKAPAGGGGRGMRAVRGADELDAAWERCRSEAQQGFGRDELYVERLLPGARHIEVQILGDATGAVTHLWERDCSAQRRHQKLIEIAPASALPAAVRDRLIDSALRMAGESGCTGLGTVEFLVSGEEFHFIEVNPRLQVEHTVTEEITGVDLVAVQLRLAAGESLAALGLTRPPEPRGFAVQAPIWAPSGELGGMGLEGTVRLGYRKELAAVAEPAERQAAFERRVAELYEHGKAVNAAAALEIDAVIDPAASREWIVAALDGWSPEPVAGGRRAFVDTW